MCDGDHVKYRSEKDSKDSGDHASFVQCDGTIIFSVAAIFFFKVLNPGMGAGMITQTEISTVHTIFNIGTTLLLFPVSDWIIKLARKLQKEEDGVVDESRVLLVKGC